MNQPTLLLHHLSSPHSYALVDTTTLDITSITCANKMGYYKPLKVFYPSIKIVIE